MAIKVGDALPNTTFRVMTSEGPKPKPAEEVFKGRKVVLFAVPGAFTPTCSKNHLPGFVKNAAAIKAKSEALEGEGADKQLMQTVMLRLAEAFETAKVPLVPQIQLGGDGGNAFNTLLSLMGSLKAKELAQTIEAPEKVPNAS